MLPEEPIRPLYDVWLRPRRVFRNLAAKPVHRIEYLLGALQGIAGWLALSRAENAGATRGVAEIFGKALLVGPIAGISSLLLMSAIYTRLVSQTGKASARNQVVHILAYGGVPMVASLALWIFAALFTGEATFEQDPLPAIEGFAALLLNAQFTAYVLLTIWSILIQVMGFSELQGIRVPKALGLWVIGQVVGFLALIFLVVLIATLFPNALIR